MILIALNCAMALALTAAAVGVALMLGGQERVFPNLWGCLLTLAGLAAIAAAGLMRLGVWIGSGQ